LGGGWRREEEEEGGVRDQPMGFPEKRVIA